MQIGKLCHEHQFEQLKSILTSFVIAQLEAEPEIEWWQLRDQVVRILGIKYDPRTPDHFHEAPYAFRVLKVRKDDPIVWAIVDRGDAFKGFGGSRIVVEAYVVDNGKAGRLTAGEYGWVGESNAALARRPSRSGQDDLEIRCAWSSIARQ